MAKIQIGTQVQEITSKAGKPYKKFNVKDEKGVVTNDVVAFPFYSQYGAIVGGALIEGIITEKEYNGSKSYSINDGNLGSKPSGFGAQAMKAKAEGIERAQVRKESGIEISATARDATLIVTSFYQDLSPEEIKQKWLFWRKWLLANWNNPEGTDLTSSGDPVPDFTINPESIPF